MQDKFKKMSESGTSSTVSGALASLWRKILREIGIIYNLEFYVNKYVSMSKDVNKRVGVLKRKSKASLVSDITSDEMSWKVFTNLLFTFINIRRIKITVTLYHGTSKVTTHEIVVDNADHKKTEKDNHD